MPLQSPHASALARVEAQRHEVELLGGLTRWWEYGDADAQLNLVLVHGYRGDHHGLEPVVAALAPVIQSGQLRVLSPDLPGFGESSPLRTAPHSIAGYGLWLDAFLDARSLRGRAVLLGHSFGSIVVAHAIAAGTPAPRLVLINPIASDPMRGVNGLLSRLTRVYYRVGRALPPRAGAAWLGNPLIVRFMSVSLAKTRDRTLRRWIHEEHGRYFSSFADRDTLAEGFDASLSTDVSAVAAELTVPTLLIAGEDDTIAPAPAQRALAARLPSARLVMLPGVGHLIHYERPDDAAAEISDFLELDGPPQ